MLAPSNILEVKDLTTRFDITDGILSKPRARVHAVEDVSFEIGKGETLGLVGESGCGKTTTGRTILGLEPATSGDIIFNGKSVFEYNRAERIEFSRSVQMIFQDPYSSLNPRMSVFSTLSEPIRVHKLYGGNAVKERVGDLLKKVNLDAAMAKRYPHEFSGGQRQRIALARALVGRPRVLILDEGTNALDNESEQSVLKSLREIRKDRIVIVVAHSLATIADADRIAVLDKGCLVEMGAHHELLEKKGSYEKLWERSSPLNRTNRN